jgi:hypothetical protein
MKKLAMLGVVALIGMLPNIASAGTRIGFGIGFNFGGIGIGFNDGFGRGHRSFDRAYIYASPRVYYSAPQAVYCPPPVTYYTPPVVYSAPPVAYCPPPVYYSAPPVYSYAPVYSYQSYQCAPAPQAYYYTRSSYYYGR